MPSMNLSTVSRVKARLYSGSSSEPSQVDALLEQLISQVSDDIEQRCHRRFLETAYTWYLDGNDQQRLYLPQGPVSSVTSVSLVEYGETGDGSRTETLTTINPGSYLVGGLRADGCRGAGWLEMIGSEWTAGTRNYKVLATCGWVNDVILDPQTGGVPRDIVGACTAHVCALFNLRDMDGLSNRSVGEGSRSSIPLVNLEAALERACMPYVLEYRG